MCSLANRVQVVMVDNACCVPQGQQGTGCQCCSCPWCTNIVRLDAWGCRHRGGPELAMVKKVDGEGTRLIDTVDDEIPPVVTACQLVSTDASYCCELTWRPQTGSQWSTCYCNPWCRCWHWVEVPMLSSGWLHQWLQDLDADAQRRSGNFLWMNAQVLVLKRCKCGIDDYCVCRDTWTRLEVCTLKHSRDPCPTYCVRYSAALSKPERGLGCSRWWDANTWWWKTDLRGKVYPQRPWCWTNILLW